MLGSTPTLCIEYPHLDLLPVLLTSRVIYDYCQSHPDFFRIYVYHPICHFRDIILRLPDATTDREHIVPFTVFPLQSGNALYGFAGGCGFAVQLSEEIVLQNHW